MFNNHRPIGNSGILQVTNILPTQYFLRLLMVLLVIGFHTGMSPVQGATDTPTVKDLLSSPEKAEQSAAVPIIKGPYDPL